MATVRIGGRRIDLIAPVSDLVDSTVYRSRMADDPRLGWSGDYQASCVWRAELDISSPWLQRGQTYEVIEHGLVTWGGLLNTPEAVDGGWLLPASGYGAQLDDWRALNSGATAPTMVPNDAVDFAHSNRSMPAQRFTNSLGTTAVGTTSGEFVSVATVLDRGSYAAGLRYWSDSIGELSLVSDPVAPIWATMPNSAYIGTADDNFITDLYGYYVSTVTGGVPSAWGLVVVSDAEAAIRFGRREAVVDLTALGLMSSGTALANITGRFALVGARMGWTNGLDLTTANLRRIGFGQASPLSMCGRNGAGSMLRIPGITDTRSSTTTRGWIDLILGEVTRYHDEERVTALPLGLVDRSFTGALEAAQASSTSTEAA